MMLVPDPPLPSSYSPPLPSIYMAIPRIDHVRQDGDVLRGVATPFLEGKVAHCVLIIDDTGTIWTDADLVSGRRLSVASDIVLGFRGASVQFRIHRDKGDVPDIGRSKIMR